jgi:zinc finger protein
MNIGNAAEGMVYTARILSRNDLNRQIVRSPSCAIIIPEYELTLPASRGQLTTVEGLIRDVVADLSADQPLRRIENEAAHAQIQSLIDKLKEILADDIDDEVQTDAKTGLDEVPMPPFTLKLDDPAGNSFIEFVGSMADPKWNVRTYSRTRQQNMDLGLSVPDGALDSRSAVFQDDAHSFGWQQKTGDQVLEEANEEIYAFPGVCPSCGNPLSTLMKKVIIPYFKVCSTVPARRAIDFTYYGLRTSL